MAKFKVIYDVPFGNLEEIIDADSLEGAERIADLKSVYRRFTVIEIDESEQADLSEKAGREANPPAPRKE